MSKPTLLFIGPVDSRSGYGEHSKSIVNSLLKIDKYDIKILSIRWGTLPRSALKKGIDDEIISKIIPTPNLPKKPEISIQLSVPNEFQQIAMFNIGITAGIETTICSPAWIEGLNRMNFNIVPSIFAKNVFVNTKYTQQDNVTKQVIGNLSCTKPIHVLFEGVDTSIFYKTENIQTKIRHELNKIKEDFVFLFVGHWLQGGLGADRKDVGMLIKTFLETFKNKPNKPALLLKTGNTFSYIDRLDTIRKIEAIKKDIKGDLPNIYLLFGDLSSEDMNGLYNHSKIKIHVSFTKGEGFGRPLLEASLSEKPIMVSGWSGHVDFLPKELVLLLPGEIKQVHPSAVWNGVIEPNSSWFNINYSFASQVMVDVWKRYQTFLPNARLLAQQNKEKFSFDKMIEELDKIMEENVPKFPETKDIVLPPLPKLKRTNENIALPVLPKLKKIGEDK